MSDDPIAERLTQLEAAVRRAADALARLREENERLRRDTRRLEDERRQVVAQIDTILRDIGKLDLGAAP
jgi:predicted nuclease with TOPRIM domain